MGTDPADGFVLNLALASNELNHLEIVFRRLYDAWPDKPTVDANYGYLVSMRTWVNRLTYALFHELLAAIAKANEEGLLSSARFKRSVEHMAEEVRPMWERLVRIAIGADLTAEEQTTLKRLVRVRNKSAHHYSDFKDLQAAYTKYFARAESNDFNEHAYAAVGLDMLAQMRFFFADAAAAFHLDDGSDDAKTARKTAGDFRLEVGQALAMIVISYTTAKHLEAGQTQQ